tara:strand:- start:36 stop:143 length:108 start_codon:yes stop_codon:yes gene_type:complete
MELQEQQILAVVAVVVQPQLLVLQPQVVDLVDLVW